MKGRILGLITSVLFIILTASFVFASQETKYGQAKTPPFPQPAENELQKIVYIRYAPEKEPVCNNNGVCEPKENWKSCPSDCQKGKGGEEPTPTPKESTCYGFLAGSKPRWNWTEDYYYNDLSLKESAQQAVLTWENPVNGEVFGQALAGEGAWGEYDLQNSIVYGDYSDPEVIAVTAIWYRGKNIYEYDILFDTDYFPSLDLESVVLHEFGHGAGLDDLYETSCDGNVMYGYYHGVDLDLGPGDIAGIQTLYGEK